MEYIWKINGELIASPIFNPEDTHTAYDLDKAEGTGTNEGGYTVRTSLRKGVRQIPLNFAGITQAELSQIDRLTEINNFELYYYDDLKGAYVTKLFNRAEISYSVMAMAPEGNYYKANLKITEV